MNEGTIVVFVEDPLMYGRMWIVEVTSNGHLLCESLHEKNPDGSYRREVFHPQELRQDTPARETA